jgi:thiamine biosynthesis lipoprotein
MTRLAAVVCVAGLLGGSFRSTSEPVSREAYLMGTRATLSTWDAERTRGLARLETLLRALEQTDAQLSTWRGDSEVSRLNASAGGGSVAVSASLCAVLKDLDRWNRETGGAFDAAIGALTSAWDIHGRGRLPDARAGAEAQQQSGWSRIGLDTVSCAVTLPAGMALDVGGFGKGEALDRARAALGNDPAPWLVDLGGQVAVSGAPPGEDGWGIGVAHPQRRADPVLHLRLSRGSLSTSGGSERDLHVGGRRVGHILDPHTGKPALFFGSVSVWHEQALAADVLSTALYVMGPEEGTRWADAHDIAAVYLVPRAGGLIKRASRAFVRLFG